MLRRTPSGSSNASATPSLSAPVLVRQSSSAGTRAHQYDWHLFLTIEERQAVRQKIKQAYQATCPSYEELLETVIAIEEELLHISTPHKLDYFKSACQYEKRVVDKRKQLAGQLALGLAEEQEDGEDQGPPKRTKTES